MTSAWEAACRCRLLRASLVWITRGSPLDAAERRSWKSKCGLQPRSLAPERNRSYLPTRGRETPRNKDMAEGGGSRERFGRIKSTSAESLIERKNSAELWQERRAHTRVLTFMNPQGGTTQDAWMNFGYGIQTGTMALFIQTWQPECGPSRWVINFHGLGTSTATNLIPGRKMHSAKQSWTAKSVRL